MEDAELPGWVAALYADPIERASRASLVTLLLELSALLSRRAFSDVDALLLNVDFQRLPPASLMGFVRATAVARQCLPSWQAATSRAGTELQARGLPVEELMAGLLVE